MLGAFILILLGVLFFRLVKKYNRPNAWLYILLAVLVWVVGVFLGGIILYLFYPQILNEDMGKFVITLALSGTLLTGIFYWILANFFRKKAMLQPDKRDDLLD